MVLLLWYIWSHSANCGVLMSYSYLEKVADTPTCLRPKTKKKFRIAGSIAAGFRSKYQPGHSFQLFTYSFLNVDFHTKPNAWTWVDNFLYLESIFSCEVPVRSKKCMELSMKKKYRNMESDNERPTFFVVEMISTITLMIYCVSSLIWNQSLSALLLE